MTVQEYLEQAWNLNDFINIKLEEIRQLKRLATNTSADFSKEYISGGHESHNRIGGIVSKIITLEQKINDEIDRLVDLKQEIHEVINRVPDPIERKLLGYRYLNMLTWSKVADEMRCSERNVYDIHAAALKNVVIPKVMQ